MSRIDELTNALNNYQITDDEGAIQEEAEVSAIPETVEEETAEAEIQSEEVQSDDDIDAEDEKGNKYIPESRFKDVYSKMKRYERELDEVKKSSTVTNEVPARDDRQQFIAPVQEVTKADILEVKLFDRRFDPDSDSYDDKLDELAFNYLVANPRMTPLQAAKKALGTVEAYFSKANEVSSSNKAIKKQVVASNTRTTTKREPSVNTDSMTEKQLEEYLKSRGEW